MRPQVAWPGASRVPSFSQRKHAVTMMHPDDQPPAEKPRPLPKFPDGTLALMLGLLTSLAVAISGVDSYSLRWWTIVVGSAALYFTTRIFLWRLVRYVASRSTLTITPRRDDPSI